jgi:hypothetical protein
MGVVLEEEGGGGIGKGTGVEVVRRQRYEVA